jgi:antirestriction protein ArdC
MKTTKEDIYTQITNRIVAALEDGVRPWHQPWNAAHAAGKITRPLRHNGTPYSGINVIMLWSEAVAAGYSAPIWMTYRQAKELGGQVRKGEHGATVVYANRIHKTEIDEDTGEERERDIPFMKGYTVFNVEQIEGLPAHYYATEIEPVLAPVQRDARAEAFFAATGADIRFGGNRAYYAPGSDHIQMPPFEFFEDPQSFYATLAHETTHWTRHPSRLDRDFGRKRFGDEGYAMEELVAELGSAFLSADLDLTPEVREDHVAYIENWLKVLKSDKRAIFTAAAHAQRACDLLHGLQPQPAPEPEPDPDPQTLPTPAPEAAPISGEAHPASDPPEADDPPPWHPPRQLDLF